MKSVGSSARRFKMAGTINSRPPRSAPRESKNQTTGAPKSPNKHAVSVRGIPLRQKLLEAEKTLRIDRYRPPQRTLSRRPKTSCRSAYHLITRQGFRIPFLAKKMDPGLCTSNEGNKLKFCYMNVLDKFSLLFCFCTFCVRQSIDTS